MSKRRRDARLYKAYEEEIVDFLRPFFRKQILTTAKEIRTGGQFRAEDWDERLINAVAPVLTTVYAKELDRQAFEILEHSPFKSTASNYLQSFSPFPLEDTTFDTPSGKVDLGFVTQYPDWMKKAILEYLHDSFHMDYWQVINQTTQTDILKVIQEGIEGGWGSNKIARVMIDRLGGEYSISRARMIARTELGNVLNGARVRSIDHLLDEIGAFVPAKKVWLSVRGPTTRDTHADLDGIPANEDGVWYVGGHEARWPGDISLPIGERANCQCTVVTEFGMTDQDAQELLDGAYGNTVNVNLDVIVSKGMIEGIRYASN